PDACLAADARVGAIELALDLARRHLDLHPLAHGRQRLDLDTLDLHDLSPFPRPRDGMHGPRARGGTRTPTGEAREILSLVRLPVPPLSRRASGCRGSP